jgi:hypothetical protein
MCGMPQASSAFSLHNYCIHNITLGIGVKITISKRKFQKKSKRGQKKKRPRPIPKESLPKKVQEEGTRKEA